MEGRATGTFYLVYLRSSAAAFRREGDLAAPPDPRDPHAPASVHRVCSGSCPFRDDLARSVTIEMAIVHNWSSVSILHQAFDEQVGCSMKNPYFTTLTIRRQTLSNALGHESDFLPFHQLALAVLGPALGFRAFRGDSRSSPGFRSIPFNTRERSNRDTGGSAK